MQKLILPLVVALFFTMCNQKTEAEKNAQKVIDNTQHDLDSMDRRYARIQKIMNAGDLTLERATAIVDSIDGNVAKIAP